jgi:hypothetical protein
MLCPAAETGRSTLVVMYPPESLIHASRIPSGLLSAPLSVPEYPPETKLPPAAMMSWKAPPLIEISSTPPSKS